MYEVRTYIIKGAYVGNYNEFYRFDNLDDARAKRKEEIKKINDAGVFRASLYPTIFQYKKATFPANMLTII